jgi:hypothetical protein
VTLCCIATNLTLRPRGDEQDQLSAGTVFEVKCLFAIDSITAVYRGRLGAKAMDRSRRPNYKAEQAEQNAHSTRTARGESSA